MTVALSVVLRAGAEASCSIPLEPTRTAFTANVWIEKTGPFRFLFDTGATQTVVTPEVARTSGIESAGALKAVGTTSVVEVQRGLATQFRVGELSVASLNVLITPLPRFPSHGHVDGLIGMDVLAGRSFVLDIRRRCVLLDVNVAGGSEISSSESIGRVALHVDGLNFILDSAASFIVLMSERAQRLAVVHGGMEMTSAAGMSRAASGVIRRLQLAGVTLRDAQASMTNGSSDPREDALLPVTMFESVWVSADRTKTILNGRLLADL